MIVLIGIPIFGLMCNIASAIFLASRSHWYFGITAFVVNLCVSFLCGSASTPKGTNEGSWIGLFGFAAVAIVVSIIITIVAFLF